MKLARFIVVEIFRDDSYARVAPAVINYANLVRRKIRSRRSMPAKYISYIAGWARWDSSDAGPEMQSFWSSFFLLQLCAASGRMWRTIDMSWGFTLREDNSTCVYRNSIHALSASRAHVIAISASTYILKIREKKTKTGESRDGIEGWK